MSDWNPSASRQVLIDRAQWLALVREFFAVRGVQEQQTPSLSLTAVTDPNIQSIFCEGRYLQTSPEYHMKRLLAAYPSDMFQLTKAFRKDEFGRQHMPEFTLLEWYRTGMHWRDLAMEVCELIEYLAAGYVLLEAPNLISYQEAFAEALQVDPFVVDLETLQTLAGDRGLQRAKEYGRATLLEFLFDAGVTTCFRPSCITVVYYYPASQAALARLYPEDPRVAERFECYFGSLELANGFAELGDVIQQKTRFEDNIRLRRDTGKEEIAIDFRLLSALQHGLPECSGVALGFDRLLYALSGVDSIEQVVSFSWQNA